MSVKVTSTQRKLYTMRHAGKSDIELEQYILQIVQKVQSISASSPGALVQAEELLAEATICQEIIEGRKAKRDRIQRAHEEWEENLPKRRLAAILNLKEAVTPNGQLVAAILEDEGSLSEQEISAWCDELAAMEQSALHALLEALVQAGVLAFQNNKYSLRQICTESLFPENPIEWALRRLGGKELSDEEKAILKMLEIRKSALSPEDFLDIVNTTNDRTLAVVVRALWGPQPNLKEKYQALKDRLKEDCFGTIIYGLARENLLTSEIIDGVDLYYFPMLGERRAD